jgi:hypothetical protein
MSLRTAVMAIVALGGTAACASRKVDVTSSPGEVAPARSASASSTAAGSIRWTAALAPQAGGTVAGTATVAPGTTSGTTVVVVSIRGGTPGAIYPWHVHSGQCGDNGSIVGSASAYPSLTANADGTGQANATLPIPAPSSGSYYVNVHASPSDMGTIVSCGNLAAAGG